MMKTLLFLLTIWGILGLVQCKQDADETARLGQELQLRTQQGAAVAVAPGAVIQLNVTKLEDSRCRSDVTCVWAGQATVEVELRNGTGSRQNVTLCLGGCPNDSAAVVLDAVPYWLQLLAVAPYPSRATQAVPRTATLRLTRQ